MDTNSDLESYVWMWLPDHTDPTPIGHLKVDGPNIFFEYLSSYLDSTAPLKVAIPVYEPELPLRRGKSPLIEGFSIPSCIRDAAPDAWGRRVILNRLYGGSREDNQPDYVNEITFLLNSSSDRIGALDFQLSANEYVPRTALNASLNTLDESADRLEKGLPLNDEFNAALFHGTSIGGARPKALIEDDGKKYIAKFSRSSDHMNFIKMEFIAMKLARLAGLDVANVCLATANEKDVLLVERFDREKHQECWLRRHMVSGLTLLELDEMMARYASYETLAEVIRYRFANPKKTLRELFSRLVFNVLCGNTDDHARNHSAFWDGKSLTLTPAYDICPQSRAGQIASQAMSIIGRNNFSQLKNCVATAHNFLLSMSQANEIIESIKESIHNNWKEICLEAGLTSAQRNALWGKQFLNPFAFE